MKDSESKLPDQKELEKELNDYLGKKYGDRVRLVVPMLFPKAQAEEVSKEASRGDEVCVYYYKDSLAEKVAARPDIFRKVR